MNRSAWSRGLLRDATTGATPGGAAGGDLTGTFPSPSLAAIGSAAGPIGDGTHVAQVTIDTKGRVTTLASVAISGAPPIGSASGDLGGTYPGPSVLKINGVAYTADPLAQYLLLAGRAGTVNNPVVSTDGDGTIAGSAASGKDLILKSTTHATKGKIIFGAAATSAYDEVNDRLGLGTAAPTTRVHVVDGEFGELQLDGSENVVLAYGSGEGAGAAQFAYGQARGTRSSKAAIQNGDGPIVNLIGYDGSGFVRGAAIVGRATETWGSSHNMALAFKTSSVGDPATDQMILGEAGDLDLLNGKLTTYAALSTAGMGVPVIVDAQSLTAQTADIADTAFANSGVSGLYRISVYLVATTADVLAGAVTANIKFNDGTGARTVTVGPVVLTALGAMAQATIVARRGSGSITYGVTHTGIFGTADFALYATCERLT